VNGEAIYATRPWKQFGEGGNRGVRFTTKGKNLYAISLAWPTNGITIASLATTNAVGRVKSVTLLGHKSKLDFSQDEAGLKINLPAEKPCDYAWAFKITRTGMRNAAR
jgi:alpha-L-fucosidase